jgi:hypothetical protein
VRPPSAERFVRPPALEMHVVRGRREGARLALGRWRLRRSRGARDAACFRQKRRAAPARSLGSAAARCVSGGSGRGASGCARSSVRGADPRNRRATARVCSVSSSASTLLDGLAPQATGACGRQQKQQRVGLSAPGRGVGSRGRQGDHHGVDEQAKSWRLAAPSGPVAGIGLGSPRRPFDAAAAGWRTKVGSWLDIRSW